MKSWYFTQNDVGKWILEVERPKMNVQEGSLDMVNILIKILSTVDNFFKPTKIDAHFDKTKTSNIDRISISDAKPIPLDKLKKELNEYSQSVFQKVEDGYLGNISVDGSTKLFLLEDNNVVEKWLHYGCHYEREPTWKFSAVDFFIKKRGTKRVVYINTKTTIWLRVNADIDNSRLAYLNAPRLTEMLKSLENTLNTKINEWWTEVISNEDINRYGFLEPRGIIPRDPMGKINE